MPNFTKAEIKQEVAKITHWYHQIEVGQGITTPGVNESAKVLKGLALPADARGLRVLDLGTRDGYFAFEMKKRGADVVAIDYLPKHETGFAIAEKLTGVKGVKYIQDNIYNLSSWKYGKFDIVLFLGLLYHLPDPIRAINIVRSMCRGVMLLETQGLDEAVLKKNGKFTTLKALHKELDELPLMQFYPKNSLNNDGSNYWAPNMPALIGMVEECNFKVYEEVRLGMRIMVKAQVVQDKKAEYMMDIATGRRNPRSANIEFMYDRIAPILDRIEVLKQSIHVALWKMRYGKSKKK